MQSVMVITAPRVQESIARGLADLYNKLLSEGLPEHEAARQVDFEVCRQVVTRRKLRQGNRQPATYEEVMAEYARLWA